MSNGNKQSAVSVRERKRHALAPSDLEHILDRAFRGPWLRRRFWPAWPSLRREVEWMPEMDVFEREGKTIIRIDLPGLKREDIEVAVEADMLVVRGRREEEKEIKEENYYCAERTVGEFSRAVSLPEGVTSEDIEATYQNGVLEVIVPRPLAAETTSTKIEVK
jgi:HSP20 family protein